MANNVVAIDLGAYSVKMVVASGGFRHTGLVEYVDRPVPPGKRHDALARACAVAAQLLREREAELDSVYLAVPSNLLHSRVLEFGFRHLKRADLEKAVGSELEGMLPFDLDELVYTFDGLPRDLGEDRGAEVKQVADPAVEEEPTFVRDPTFTGGGRAVSRGTSRGGVAEEALPPPGRVAAPSAGMRVLACAMPQARARELLLALARAEMAPRGLVVGTSGYAQIVQRSEAVAVAHNQGAAVGVVDIGHQRTDFCVVKGGRMIYTRGIERGGRDVTEAIARAWKIPYDEAEQAKHQDGFVGSEAEPPSREAWRRIHAVVVEQLAPIARELRRTLRACRAETGAAPAVVLLVGGGARLRGIASYLSQELQVPVSLLGLDDAERLLGKELSVSAPPVDAGAMAIGVALEAATGRVLFDLRQGALAYKADFSFLRQKLAHIAAAALIIVAFVAVNAYAALYKLRSDEHALEERLALETVEVSGKQLTAEEVLEMVGPAQKKEISPLPKLTAYDILHEINNKLPARDAVKLDVRSLDIRRGQITLQASAASPAEVEQVEKGLAAVDCFDSVSKPNISTGPDDVKSFSISIKTSCM
jgi:Tfp pilus assembly PilM family ATPase